MFTACGENDEVPDNTVGDWYYDKLPSNYEIWQVDEEYNALVQVGNTKNEEGDIVVDESVSRFSVVKNVIYVECKSLENKKKIVYYIIDSETNKKSSPLKKSEFEEKCKENGIDKIEWTKADEDHMKVEY